MCTLKGTQSHSAQPESEANAARVEARQSQAMTSIKILIQT